MQEKINKMPAEEEAQSIERRNVCVGIRIDNNSRELLNWALVKVAEAGDCVIALHVCRNSSKLPTSHMLIFLYMYI